MSDRHMFQKGKRLSSLIRIGAPAVLLLWSASPLRAESVVEVRCKPMHGRVETPVMLPLQEAQAHLTGELTLVEDGTARRVPAMVLSEPARMLCFVMPTRAGTGAVRRFRMTNDKPSGDGFAIAEPDKDRVAITEGGRGVATFIRGDVLKPGVPQNYRRSCYFHPVYDLDGAVLTDDFPRDHFHHRGMSWAWPRVEAAGKVYDQWGIRGVRHRHVRILSRQTGVACAVLRVANQWVAGERPIVNETAEFCFWRAGDHARTIDVFLTFTAIDTPVKIGGEVEYKKGYGGFNVRFAPRRDTVVMGPRGRQPDFVSLEKLTWSDLSGRFTPNDDRTSGLAIFDGPGNPLYPNEWNNRTYGYLNPSWPAMGQFELKPGVPLRLRYRVRIHRGDAVAGHVAEAQQVFADLPDGAIIVSQ